MKQTKRTTKTKNTTVIWSSKVERPMRNLRLQFFGPLSLQVSSSSGVRCFLRCVMVLCHTLPYHVSCHVTPYHIIRKNESIHHHHHHPEGVVYRSVCLVQSQSQKSPPWGAGLWNICSQLFAAPCHIKRCGVAPHGLVYVNMRAVLCCVAHRCVMLWYGSSLYGILCYVIINT